MSEKLKPCPFCGSNEVEIKHVVSVKGDVNDYFGSCKKCRINMRCFKTEEEAIKAWNRRPSPWHTGMPTEEDVKDIDEDNAYCFAICMFYDKWWLSDYLFKVNIEKGCFEAETAHDGIVEIPFERGYQWQKIEPYKE